MKSYEQVVKEIDRKSNLYWKEMQEMLDSGISKKKQEELTQEDKSKIKFTDQLNAQIQILKWVTD